MSLQKDPQDHEGRHLRRIADATDRRVLEIGCGDGRLTWRYANAARNVVGIDLERDDLRVAFIERPSDLETRVALLQADSVRLPFADGSFDLAIFAWSF